MKKSDKVLEKSDKVLVFVYGSLLSGLANHTRIKDEEFVCEDYINATLHTSNWYWPFIRLSDESKVKGEVYRVTYGCVLDDLDRLENYHPECAESVNLFNRREVTTESGLRVFVYEGGDCFNSHSFVKIDSGDWKQAIECKLRATTHKGGH